MLQLSATDLEKLAELIANRVVEKLGSAPATDGERFVTIHELAKASNLSQSTLYRAIAAGRLSAKKLAGALRFHLPTALEEISAAGPDLTKPKPKP